MFLLILDLFDFKTAARLRIVDVGDFQKHEDSKFNDGSTDRNGSEVISSGRSVKQLLLRLRCLSL